MKNGLLTALLALPALALPSFGTSITAIYGSGNPAAGWTDSGTVKADIQLALRAKNRVTGDASNVDGVYTFADAPDPRGLWNYEFSINSDFIDGSTKLSAYDYYLSIDTDSSQGISTGTTVDPLTFWTDNSYGDNTTASGQGIEGTSILADSNNLVQNSQNITFLGLPLLDNATYTYELFATSPGEGVDGKRLASVSITVIVGSGGAAVPDGGATAILLGVGLVGLAGLRSRKSA
jgi:hypothetical protein